MINDDDDCMAFDADDDDDTEDDDAILDGSEPRMDFFEEMEARWEDTMIAAAIEQEAERERAKANSEADQ